MSGSAMVTKEGKVFYAEVPNLIVSTYHKSLLGILRDRMIMDMDNPRLMKMREKMFGYKFKIIHTPGRSIIISRPIRDFEFGTATCRQSLA